MLPEFLSVDEGNLAFFTCTLNIMIEWTHNGVHIKLSEKYLQVRNVLIIHGVKRIDQGLYHCQGRVNNISTLSTSSELIVYREFLSGQLNISELKYIL